MSKCPCCSKKGLAVETITVICHARERKWPIKDERYFICENPDCGVIYFSREGGQILRKEDIRTTVTFKEKTSPRPLCYCKQVTEEDVIKAINNGAKTLDEVMEVTHIGGGGFCKFTNPYGRCCSRNYMPFIERELKKAGEKLS